MKRSRRTPSRSTQCDVHEGLAAQALNSPQPVSDPAEDRLRTTGDARTPLSLKSGAGRQYWDEVLRLLVKIRADCDAAAERLGYASSQDDGLAAVEHIANKILQAVWGERQQQIASAKKQSATRSPDVAQQSATEAPHKSDKRAQPAGHPERSKLIGELKQMLRDGKTKSGVVIDPQLAHEIAKQITILNEDIAATPQSMRRIRGELARLFDKASGRQTKPSKAAAAALAEKRKRPKIPLGAKKTVTKRSVTHGSKGSKRRSR